MDRETLENSQPLLFKGLERGFKEGLLPQAILLYGSQRCRFREIARFIGQSLACTSKGLACGECQSCRRFLSGIHPDYVEIEGGDSNIRKEQIEKLREFFSMEAVENSTRRRGYSIIDCQKMTEEAANSLLKFLEEPSPSVTAILTAPTLEAVLPTIISRCEPIRLNPRPREEIYEFLKERYSPEVAYFLSSFSGDDERLMEAAESEDFLLASGAATDFIRSLDRGHLEASYTLLLSSQTCQGHPRCYNHLYRNLSRFLADALAQDGLFGPFSKEIQLFGRENADLAARMELSLRESWSMSKANLSFIGVLAQLSLLLATG